MTDKSIAKTALDFINRLFNNMNLSYAYYLLLNIELNLLFSLES